MQQNQAPSTSKEALKKAAKILYEVAAFGVDLSESSASRTRAEDRASDALQFGMPGADGWVKNNASNLGLSQAEAYSHLSRLGNALGQSGQADVIQSKNASFLLERSVAVAFETGKDPGEVVDAFAKALSGDTSALISFGLNISSVANEGDEDIATAVINAIDNQTSKTWTRFISEEVTSFRATDILTAELENLKANGGDFVQPFVGGVAEIGSNALGFINGIIQGEADMNELFNQISVIGEEKRAAATDKADDARILVATMRELEMQNTEFARKQHEILQTRLLSFDFPAMEAALSQGTGAVLQSIADWEQHAIKSVDQQELQAKVDTLALLEQSIYEAEAQRTLDWNAFGIEARDTLSSEFALLKEHLGLTWDGTPDGLLDMWRKGDEWLSTHPKSSIASDISDAISSVYLYSSDKWGWQLEQQENDGRIDLLTQLYAKYLPHSGEWLKSLAQMETDNQLTGITSVPEETAPVESKTAADDPAVQEVLASLESFLSQMPELSTNLTTTDTALAESVNNLVGINTALDALCISLNSAIQNIPTTIATMAPIQVYCSGGGGSQDASPTVEMGVDSVIEGVRSVVNGLSINLDGEKVGSYVDNYITRKTRSQLAGRGVFFG